MSCGYSSAPGESGGETRERRQRRLRPRPGGRARRRRANTQRARLGRSAELPIEQANVASSPPPGRPPRRGDRIRGHPRPVDPTATGNGHHTPGPDAEKIQKFLQDRPWWYPTTRRAPPGRDHATAGRDGRPGLRARRGLEILRCIKTPQRFADAGRSRDVRTSPVVPALPAGRTASSLMQRIADLSRPMGICFPGALSSGSTKPWTTLP